jgi:6,7-dimethyl-8-ribityllumazine synthase
VTEETPITFGVITADTMEQARDRVGGKHGHKGEEAAMAALELCDVLEQLSRAGR